MQNLKKNKIKQFFFIFALSLILNVQARNGDFQPINIQQEFQQTKNSTQHRILTSSVPIPTWLQQSEAELSRFMLDIYNYFVTPKGNKIWGCAMNLAWNDLKRKLLRGEDAVFSNANQIQQKIVQNLEKETFTKKQLSQSSYYVHSGYGKSTIQKINKQVRQKFPERTFQNLAMDLQQKDFISFAYLFKKIQYLTSFQKIPFFNFKNQIVEGFQAITSKQKKSLYYKYYRSSNDFFMGIQTINPNEQIYLFRTPDKEMKNFTIEKVMRLIEMYDKLPNNRLHKQDQFRMPVLDFDYSRQFSEMVGMKFANQELNMKYINTMKERVKLKMNNQGVTVQNQAIIAVTTGYNFDAKFFHLNGDFWLVLKEKNKKPYMVMQVTSTTEQWTN